MKGSLALSLLALAAAGCGGGGSGAPVASATMVGRVLDVQTGGPPSPQASVAVPSITSSLTSISDGSFSLAVSAGANQLLVTSLYPAFSFSTKPASVVTDVGDLWIGPLKVTLRGRVIDASTLLPVSGAHVSFAGASGNSLADGTFGLLNVAYSNASQVAFAGIAGTLQATNYYDQSFTAGSNVAVSGSVDVGDLLVTPSNNSTPPGSPFDITGRVLPIGASVGTIVTLKQNNVAVRTFNVGADGVYSFWVPAAAYTVEYAKAPSSTAPTQSATVVQQNSVIHVPDVTIS